MRKPIVLMGSPVMVGALAAGIVALVWMTEVAPAGIVSPTIYAANSPRSIVARVANSDQLTDGEIAYIYLQANLFEVEKAELGMARGTAPKVREHGVMVAKDHRGVVIMFEKLLKKIGLKPTPHAGSAAALKKHNEVVADLKSRSGSDFDRAYLIHEIANHRAVIKAIRESLLAAVKSEAVSAHLNEVLPAFEHHLATTISAGEKLGISNEQ